MERQANDEFQKNEDDITPEIRASKKSTGDDEKVDDDESNDTNNKKKVRL